MHWLRDSLIADEHHYYRETPCSHLTHLRGEMPAESWGQAAETVTLLQRLNLF